jgi:hypothetical protein
LNGTQGIPGPAGINGTQGPKGATGPQGPKGEAGITSLSYHECNNYQSSKEKNCALGKHKLCYLSGYKANSGVNYCDINGNMNTNWEVRASKAWCEVRCVD